MPEKPQDSTRKIEIPADAPEPDVLDQTRPWSDEEENDLPETIPDDAPEADALDQVRSVDLGDDEEEPA